MPRFVSPEAVRDQRREVVANGVPAALTTYFGRNWTMGAVEAPPPPGVIYPMAFLVEQSAGTLVQAHYHQANQWQVVVGGGGMLGRHEVAPVVVHYTNAYSSYGPLRSGPQGLHYFTLRNGYDPGAQYVPAAAPKLRAAKRRFREASQDAGPPALTPATEVLVPEAEDGLAARRHRLAPGAAFTGPDPARGLGQFWLVTAGSLLDEMPLPPLSLGFVYPEEEAARVTAGAEGAEVLVLQYPRNPAHL